VVITFISIILIQSGQQSPDDFISLGQEGKIVQIAGPQEEKQEDIWSGSPEMSMQHPRQVILIAIWRQIWKTWKEPE